MGLGFGGFRCGGVCVAVLVSMYSTCWHTYSSAIAIFLLSALAAGRCDRWIVKWYMNDAAVRENSSTGTLRDDTTPSLAS